MKMISNQNLLNENLGNHYSSPVGFTGNLMFNFTTVMYNKNNNHDYTILYLIGIALTVFIYKTIVILNRDYDEQKENYEKSEYKNTSTIIPVYEMSHVCY